MAYTLFIHKEAVAEIKEAYEWYEEQKAGLGHELIAEIETCYRLISDYPEHYSFINHLYRRIKTNRFPYIIVYEFDGDNAVVVNSVRHIKRKPR